MSWESVQICEDCWFEKNPDREPIRVIEKYRDTEPCFDCDTATSSGIFVRRERPTTTKECEVCTGKDGKHKFTCPNTTTTTTYQGLVRDRYRNEERNG